MKSVAYSVSIVGMTLAICVSAGCGTRTSIGGLGGSGGGSMGGSVGTGGNVVGTGGNVVGTGGNGAAGGNVGTGGQGAGGTGGSACNPSSGNGGGPPPLAFDDVRTFLAGTEPMLITIGELNGDGKSDLAVGNTDGNVSVLLNDGNGFFPTHVAYPGVASYASFTLGDLNGDGRMDLVSVTGSVTVALNDGSGRFSAAMSYFAGTNSISAAVGDLNGDGRADLAVANSGEYDGNTIINGDVGVLFNNGGGTTFAATNYSGGVTPGSIALGDLNGDGQLDLAVGDRGGALEVLLNKGNGTFAAAASYGAGTHPSALAIGDLNGDCKLDVALMNLYGGVSVLLNIGNGVLAAAVNYTYPGPNRLANSVAIGDLNGDGKADLVAMDPTSGVVVFLNNGSGVFTAPVNHAAAGVTLSSFALGDLNGDGKLDVAVAYESGVAVLVNASH